MIEAEIFKYRVGPWGSSVCVKITIGGKIFFQTTTFARTPIDVQKSPTVVIVDYDGNTKLDTRVLTNDG